MESVEFVSVQRTALASQLYTSPICGSDIIKNLLICYYEVMNNESHIMKFIKGFTGTETVKKFQYFDPPKTKNLT